MHSRVCLFRVSHEHHILGLVRCPLQVPLAAELSPPLAVKFRCCSGHFSARSPLQRTAWNYPARHVQTVATAIQPPPRIRAKAQDTMTVCVCAVVVGPSSLLQGAGIRAPSSSVSGQRSTLSGHPAQQAAGGSGMCMCCRSSPALAYPVAGHKPLHACASPTTCPTPFYSIVSFFEPSRRVARRSRVSDEHEMYKFGSLRPRDVPQSPNMYTCIPLKYAHLTAAMWLREGQRQAIAGAACHASSHLRQH